ncbi:MAG: hypothetical protein H6726_08865 [Sandaracinaceae bacterium]|nr:hypothetical protein [Myxococcales bacterium]MCB9657743.1 hypothetical protein [Sandaracinaceae bacterium]
MKHRFTLEAILVGGLALGALMLTTTTSTPIAHAQGNSWQSGPRYGGIAFYWRYEMNRSSVNIRAVNNTDETVTIRVHASSGDMDKDITFYSVRPGQSSSNVFCASMIDRACDGYGNPSIELESVR